MIRNKKENFFVEVCVCMILSVRKIEIIRKESLFFFFRKFF